MRLDELKPLVRGRLDLRRLHGQPRALWRRALHRWLVANPIRTDLSRQGFTLLLAAVERGRPTRFSLGTGGFAVIRNDLVHYAAVSSRRRAHGKIVPNSRPPGV
jgi:tRNA(Ile)-lysidine synthase